MARRAIELGVCCLIVCQAELPEDLRNAPTFTCIIATPTTPRRLRGWSFMPFPSSASAGRASGVPSDRLCGRREGDVQTMPPSYPILDENEKVVGTLSV